MKIHRALIRCTPWLLATGIASAGVVWSPIACSCVSAVETVTAWIARPDIKSADQLTARLLADSISLRLKGKPVSVRDLPFTTSTNDCAESPAPGRTVRCRWWLWQSPYGSTRGYDVVVSTNDNGVFRNVVVTPIQNLEREDRDDA